MIMGQGPTAWMPAAMGMMEVMALAPVRVQ